jgi:hypothetical protein
MKFTTVSILFLFLTIQLPAQVKIENSDTTKVSTIPSFFKITKIADTKEPDNKVDSLHLKNSNEKRADEDFFDQLAILPEFKQERKRIDSLRKATGTDIKLHVDYTESPYLENLSEEHFSMTILYERQPDKEVKKLFTIMFDKNKRQIFSIEDHIRHSKRFGNLRIDWNTLKDMK